MTTRNVATLRHVVAQLRAALGTARGPRAFDLLARAAEQSPNAVLLADDRGRYVWANTAATKLLGYPKTTLLDLSVWDITATEAEPEIDMLWRAFLRSGYQSGTYPVRRRSGRRQWVYYFAEPRLFPAYHVSVLKAVRPTSR